MHHIAPAPLSLTSGILLSRACDHCADGPRLRVQLGLDAGEN